MLFVCCIIKQKTVLHAKLEQPSCWLLEVSPLSWILYPIYMYITFFWNIYWVSIEFCSSKEGSWCLFHAAHSLWQCSQARLNMDCMQTTNTQCVRCQTTKCCSFHCSIATLKTQLCLRVYGAVLSDTLLSLQANTGTSFRPGTLVY